MSCGENSGDEIRSGEIGCDSNIIHRNALKLPAAKYSVTKFNTAKSPVHQKH